MGLCNEGGDFMKNELDTYSKIEAAYHDMRSTTNDSRMNVVSSSKLLSESLAEKLIKLTLSKPNGENVLLHIADNSRHLHYRKANATKKVSEEYYAEAAS